MSLFIHDLIVFVLGLVLSYLGVEWVRRNALRLKRIDVPNERSSHSVPTPRGGGLGIVVTVVVLWVLSVMLGILELPSADAVGFPTAASLAALIGWIDDRRSLPAPPRLGFYLLITGVFTLIVGSFTGFDLAVLGVVSLAAPIAFVVTLLWLVGFLNIFNFMDGIDGLAGSQAFLASLAWLLVLVIDGQNSLSLLAIVLCAVCLGFLLHNMPPARIFMGDVGSAFLGFTLAALPMMAYGQTSNPRLPVVGALFVAPFLYDGALTIIRRALKRQNIFTAHREHLYQRLVISRLPHQQVTRQYQGLMVVSGLCGLVYYFGTPLSMTIALLVVAIMLVGYTLYVSNVQTKTRPSSTAPSTS